MMRSISASSARASMIARHCWHRAVVLRHVVSQRLILREESLTKLNRDAQPLRGKALKALNHRAGIHLSAAARNLAVVVHQHVKLVL
jgi:hypothetical protein